eukprot:scaffold1135_cov343-Prasinococcus_capsulatus_cf.AAC.14
MPQLKETLKTTEEVSGPSPCARRGAPQRALEQLSLLGLRNASGERRWSWASLPRAACGQAGPAARRRDGEQWARLTASTSEELGTRRRLAPPHERSSLTSQRELSRGAEDACPAPPHIFRGQGSMVTHPP